MLQRNKEYVKNIQRFYFPKSRHRPSTQVAGISAIYWKRRETVHWACRNSASWNQEARMYRRHLPFHSIVLLNPHPSWSRSPGLSPARKTKQRSWKSLPPGPRMRECCSWGKKPHSPIPPACSFKAPSPHQYSEEVLWCGGIEAEGCFGLSPFRISSPQHCLQPLALA